jgi:hypothetical protein
MLIPHRNPIFQAKSRQSPGYRAGRERKALLDLVQRWRAGAVSVEQLTPAEREIIQVYVCDHPRYRKAVSA